MLNTLTGKMDHIYNKCAPWLYERPWLMALLFLPFFKPMSFDYMTGVFHYVDLLFTLAKPVLFLGAAALYLCRRKISGFMWALGIFELVLLVSTVINRGDLSQCLVTIVTVFGAALLTEICIRGNSRKFLKAMAFLFCTLIFLNFIVMFFYPNGIARMEYYNYACNFLEIDNMLIPIFLYGLLMTILYSEWRYGTWSNTVLVLLLCCCLMIVHVWSAGGMIGIAIFLAFLILFYHRKAQKIITPVTTGIFYVIVTLGLVVFRIQNLFAPLIEGVLHKSLTLTGRTDMWDIAFGLIAQKPILGRGVAELHGHIFYKNQFQYGHNIAVEILLVAGVIGLLAFVFLCFVVGRKLMKVRRENWAVLALATIFTLFSVGLIESFLNNVYFFLILLIAYLMPEILAQFKQETQTHPEREPISGVIPWLANWKRTRQSGK